MTHFEIDRFLEDVSGRYAARYRGAIQDLLVAVATHNAPAARDAREALAEVTRQTVGVGEIVGARLMLREASTALRSHAMRGDLQRMIAFRDQPLLPKVTLAEALEDMITRTPVTIRRAAERTAQRIAQLYAEGRNMAFVRSAEETVTKEAQALITRQFVRGSAENRAGAALSMSVDTVRKLSEAWTDGYSRMVFRTNVNTAVTAGRFRQAQDPDIRAVIPAFEFDAIGDADTRPNHEAATGIVMRPDNPGWAKIAPPLGYNCRCQVRLLSVPQLERMGRLDRYGQVRESRIPADAYPDPGFRHGGRPDIFLNGAT